MLIEIFYNQNLYARCMMNYEDEDMLIIEGPNRDITFVDSCFTYAREGFKFDFKTMKAFLNNRKINEDTKTGVYYNVDSNIKVVVIRKERI